MKTHQPGRGGRRIDPASLDQLLHPTLDPDAERDVLGIGLPASPGAACGEIVFDPDEAESSRAGASRSSWCGSKPARKTFTACTQLKVF